MRGAASPYRGNPAIAAPMSECERVSESMRVAERRWPLTRATSDISPNGASTRTRDRKHTRPVQRPPGAREIPIAHRIRRRAIEGPGRGPCSINQMTRMPSHLMNRA
jgi:hypothetical protein